MRASIEQAAARSPLLFALDAPAETAALRADAFRAAVKEWQQHDAELRMRGVAAAWCRCSVAAASYTASGGSIWAPVIAMLGALPRR